MIVTKFQRLYTWFQATQLASFNINHAEPRGPSIVLAYKFTRPPLSRHRRCCVGGTLSILQINSCSGTSSTRLIVLPDPKTCVYPLEFRWLHAYKLRYTLFRMHFRFMAAIFDVSLTQISESFQTCCIVLLDLRNLKIVLKLCCCPAHNQKLWPPSWIPARWRVTRCRKLHHRNPCPRRHGIDTEIMLLWRRIVELL